MINITVEIPYKFPSLNDYVNACRSNHYAGGGMKKKVQKDIAPYIKTLPYCEKPVRIDFLWVEKTKRRDYDNIAFAKKFILGKGEGFYFITQCTADKLCTCGHVTPLIVSA